MSNETTTLQSENRGRGSLPVIVGRSLPRAIAAARSGGDAAGIRGPAFEVPTTAGDGFGAETTSDEIRGSAMAAKKKRGAQEGLGGESRGVTFEDMVAGNPRRAMEELNLRSKLEVVRGEVDATLKMHATMAKGERTSWLKQIELQNEEHAYEVGMLPRTRLCLPAELLSREWSVLGGARW